MADDRPDPLPDDVLALLRRARPGVEPPAAARDAVFAFVAANGPAGGGPGTGGGTGGSSASPTNPGPSAAHGAARDATPVAAVGGTKTVASALLLGKAGFGVAGLAVGVVVGAAGHAAYVTPRPLPAALVSAAPPSTSAEVATSVVLPTTTANAPSPSASVSPSPSSPLATRPSSLAHDDSVSTDDSLRAERALIDTARTAVARGQGEAAFAPLQRHVREFPRGRLAEEREFLWVQALRGVGRSAEADERAARFRRTFPQSMMAPTVGSGVPAR